MLQKYQNLKKPFSDHLKNINPHSMFFTPTDCEEVNKIIMSLKPKNSHGHDKINSKLLKNLMHCLKYPLTILINKSLETGKVPSSFKLAKVIPIYKSKEKDSMNNYRPISLLPCMSKIIEKVVHRRLYNFCEMQGLLFNKQFGFRPKCSTIDAVKK